MKTDDLIAALSADAPAKNESPRRAFLTALGVGIAISALVWAMRLGPRHDFMHAISTVRFDFKFVVTLALAASALAVARRAMRPEGMQGNAGLVLLVAPGLLLLAIVAELVMVPQSQWYVRLIGHNARFCVTMIPMLSLAPLVLLLWAFRRGAPENSARAGAIAGLLAAGLGATFYAAHCPDDSPFFVATWYTLAVGFVTGLGALLGSRLLRW